VKIFVGYGYNERDRWIEEFVFPVIEAFDSEVVAGKELAGQNISDGVRRQIQTSHAFIGFLTRRESAGGDHWTTHRWVTDELATALQVPVPTVEVREVGVDEQGGIAGDRQHIVYREDHRDRCLLDVVKVIGQWHKRGNIELKLAPEGFVDEIRPFLKKPGFQCSYTLMEGDDEREEHAQVRPITGGLFVNLRNVSRSALIQVNVVANGVTWTSDFEPVNKVQVLLRKEG